ncbi:MULTISPECIES: A/G-specific adenine glycosylase [unclassified Fusibacter]|uniref:A/G-specific adenine glycosylase n=1 Tax=unclassified Fusibacter TaxID=2624464 RepID=UPI001011CC52|nr:MULTISPECIES: A/G-specific adenine glycosylase [unclassified Fusibacter]MCK8061227.1 A/G-specific adenine glycosylase [Fusibacter sp. A2]NPE23429.1 A/G-specific adenine glycosylase [Fusibacter sp. A1]RXV59208.1 A/G-specific adenine glycosylase [Fusibacter sp. A1]
MTNEMSTDLVDWYHKHHRILPWRETDDPYAIWLSEVMLQQTKVDTVIPYYTRFLKAYPTVRDLADADLDDVLKLWEGLGYYSRAKRLIPCARMVVSEYGSKFPDSKNELLKLPGIGSYTAGAILGIAFNIKEPAVDGNVFRVVSRLDRLKDDIARAKTKDVFEGRLLKILPDDMRAFNQAIMELGAMICTPKNPKCEECPIRTYCSAYRVGDILEYPVKTKKAKAVLKDVRVALVEFEGRYLMYQKAPDGLIGGFWAFPHQVGEGDEGESNESDIVSENFDYSLQGGLEIGTVKHVFSHQIWQMTVVHYKADAYFYVDEPKMTWVSVDEMDTLAISTAMKRVIQLIRHE